MLIRGKGFEGLWVTHHRKPREGGALSNTPEAKSASAPSHSLRVCSGNRSLGQSLANPLPHSLSRSLAHSLVRASALTHRPCGAYSGSKGRGVLRGSAAWPEVTSTHSAEAQARSRLSATTPSLSTPLFPPPFLLFPAAPKASKGGEALLAVRSVRELRG